MHGLDAVLDVCWGQPIEGWKRKRIEGFLKDTDNYPVERFLSSDVSEEIIHKYNVSNNGENAFCDTVTHWINNIVDMPEDDVQIIQS